MIFFFFSNKYMVVIIILYQLYFQAIKCSLTTLFFAPYFEVAADTFHQLLFGKEFTVAPDNIDCDVPLVTLYNGECNVNTMVLESIVENANFSKVVHFIDPHVEV